MVIRETRLLEKSGGKSGIWQAGDTGASIGD
jgi:molybdenum cofactor biosynthesis enzyme